MFIPSNEPWRTLRAKLIRLYKRPNRSLRRRTHNGRLRVSLRKRTWDGAGARWQSVGRIEVGRSGDWEPGKMQGTQVSVSFWHEAASSAELYERQLLHDYLTDPKGAPMEIERLYGSKDLSNMNTAQAQTLEHN